MRKKLTLENYYQGVIEGNRAVLAQALTLMESQRLDHQQLAQRLLKELLPRSGKSIRLGLSGVPGAGKSTFIECLGKKLIAGGYRVAVLAIDPSGVCGGSLLGDKTRMRDLSASDEAFIRPSPNGGRMGGVAQTTLESILICEAAGYDIVIVETVGVGQSETVVFDMTDLFVMLAIPGAGDELQGIKRGILEVVDLLVVNKADGERAIMAQQARQQYQMALSILRPSHVFDELHGHTIPVLTCSSISGSGVEDVWKTIISLHQLLKQNGRLKIKREEQRISWMWRTIEHQLLQRFKLNPSVQKNIITIQDEVGKNDLTPFEAAERLLKLQE